MNLKQSMTIVSKLHHAFFSDRFAKPEELQSRVDLYCVYFADIPFRIVNKEVDEWISTEREMPTISQLLFRCKDSLALESNPIKNPETVLPTWWHIAEARGVDMDAPPSPEIEKLADELIEALRADAKAKARYEASKKNKPDTDGNLPYEI